MGPNSKFGWSWGKYSTIGAGSAVNRLFFFRLISMKPPHFTWPEDCSPMLQLRDPLFDKLDVSVMVKRDDLLKPFGGNKGRKLKYFWKDFIESRYTGLISLGGPFSNHLYAFATMCRHFAVPGIALVRGEVSDSANPVLNYIRASGVEVVGIPRSGYARRYTGTFVSSVRERYPGYMLVPEGGASIEGVQGCHELGLEIVEQLGRSPDWVLVGAGTGTTAIGLAKALAPKSRVMAISALREKIIRPAFESALGLVNKETRGHIALNTDYHFGGFAKWDKELIGFIREFESVHQVHLEPLYTAKTAFALYDMIRRGTIEKGCRVVFVHTGGMPGRTGFNYRFPGLLESLS